MASLTITALLTILPLASAHFHLHFPAARGEDTDKQADFPCGGYPSPATTRTPISLTSGLPLSMELGHDENLISVFLAIGNDPGSAFNVELNPTVSEVGLGDFCWASLPVDVAGLGIEEGTNATVQVITNGHAGNGLYNVCHVIQISPSHLLEASAANTFSPIVRRHNIHQHIPSNTRNLHQQHRHHGRGLHWQHSR
jgi:hypothetical protein